ncbi:hypothetical protein DB346_18285 [Verrucomicrobia bacterium LW23]|nr:hypothetical protein DB346_18285 [Verrucomicrobia bacterium LW23]
MTPPLEALRPLSPGAAAPYAAMTFGPSRALLHQCGTAPGASAQAVGAEVFGAPVGLALAEIHPARPSAVLRSIYVEEPWRRRGIARRMLALLEAHLRERGVTVVGATYVSDSPGYTATEALLRTSGWSTGTPRMRLGRFHIEKIMAMPWLRLEPGDRCEIIPWQHVTGEERDRVRAWPDFPAQLSPFTNPAQEEPLVSTALRLRDIRPAPDGTTIAADLAARYGRIMGWMITHRVLPDTVRYSALYVRPELPIPGRGLSLIAHSIRRQGLVRDELRHALAGVAVANEAMSATLLRRLGPYAEGIATSYEARKSLQL